MNIYPALRAQMGSWNYYTVKMSVRELSENVKFAYEIYEDRTLDEAIQRILNQRRVKTEIVEYLKNQPNRFFSSIVVAVLNGNPMFYPIEITDAPEFSIFRDDNRLNETFGVLRFDGTQEYYALDGQHRLSAIKMLLDRNNQISDGAPEGFEKDELSVIVVVPSQTDSNETFLQKYRRLFSNLNRYAKPMDQATNIIMDEDDTLAIITRRLITENSFFKWSGRARESQKIKTEKGKNLKTGDPYFTSIEALYNMNIALLSSPKRLTHGWGCDNEEGLNFKKFIRVRPSSEEYIDSLYEELKIYWDGLLAELPVLQNTPSKMRFHEITDRNNNDGTDHLLFWPIGQQMLAEIARELLNKRLHDQENPTTETVRFALKGLNQLEWQLHQAPWKHFLLVPSMSARTGKRSWTMRNQDRTKVVRHGQIIQQWILGLEYDDADFVNNLKNQWKSFLIPGDRQTEEMTDESWQQTVEELWQQVEDKKSGMAW